MPRAKQNQRRSTLGSIWQRRDRWAAKYMRNGQWHTPGRTFTTYKLADDWLADEQRLIDRDVWTPPAKRREQEGAAQVKSTTTLDVYAREYIETRRVRSGDPLAPKTRSEYLRYLDGPLAPLAALPLVEITPGMVDRWWEENGDTRTLRHHVYTFLKQVMAHAITVRGGGLITVNPCQVPNASYVTRKTPDAVRDHRIVNLTPAGVATLANEVEPRWKTLVLLLAWTAMRPGEAMALRRSSITRTERDGLPCWTLAIHSAATTDTDAQGKAVRVIGKTKTAGSVRYVYVPPHLVDVLADHLSKWAAPGRDGLVFPSPSNPELPATVQQLWGTSQTKRRQATGFHRARQVIGSPDLTVYDLRRWGRRTLRRAGMTDLDVEQYMGHQLGRVTDAYALLDPALVWPVMVRASELAGWTKPSTAPVALPVPARLLDAMTSERLAQALAHMSDEQLQAVAAQVKPETLARALSVSHGAKEQA